MFNAVLSKMIFNQLMNGKVINKSLLNNSGEFVDNHLFIEIMDNLEDYRAQYRMSGYEFIENTRFVFIREPSSQTENLKTDITMRVYVLLLLIGKYITTHNFRLTKLTEASGGLTEEDIELIQQMPDTEELLEKSGMKRDFAGSIKSLLIDRNILLQKPSSASYLLSDAGRSFFDEIIEQYES